MRRTHLIARASALAAVASVTPSTYAAAAPAAAAIPVIQVDGLGHGHGVGMAQDGALAMGRAGSTTKQILSQFYPGTAIGKKSGPVRVPVLTANNVELTFPDGGEVRGYPAQNSPTVALPLKIAPGGKVLVYRDGDGTRVRTVTPASTPQVTTTTTTTSTTSTTTKPMATTTTTEKLLFPGNRRADNNLGTVNTTTTSTSSTTTTTTTTVPPPQPVALFTGVVTAAPSGDGRVGVTPRGHRYRGIVEMSPIPGNAVRFVNQVAVETYLRGMGEVRNPNWPAASLQSQAIAARTYALRAMAAGGELCDTQRCQVYLGADAEYSQMNAAVSATTGQVLTYGKSLASAVYSANGGGHSATRAEGFGLAGQDNFPYLRAAPYPSDNPAKWSMTIALRDVARQLKYRGEVTDVEVLERGPSGRATKVALRGSRGDVTVSGTEFDAALGLRSTLFTLRVTTATQVTTLKGGSVLQAPPEQAATLTPGYTAVPRATNLNGDASHATASNAKGVGAIGPVAVVLWSGVALAALITRRRARDAWHATLS